MHQHQAAPAIDLCIRRVQRATCGRGIFQARRALLGSLQRAGTGPKVAQDVADAAVRLGRWLGGAHALTVDAELDERPPTDGGVTPCRITKAGEAARV
jgi:hypothetical protein